MLYFLVVFGLFFVLPFLLSAAAAAPAGSLVSKSSPIFSKRQKSEIRRLDTYFAYDTLGWTEQSGSSARLLLSLTNNLNPFIYIWCFSDVAYGSAVNEGSGDIFVASSTGGSLNGQQFAGKNYVNHSDILFIFIVILQEDLPTLSCCGTVQMELLCPLFSLAQFRRMSDTAWHQTTKTTGFTS